MAGCKIKLLATQHDRNSNHLVPRGMVVPVEAFVQDPSSSTPRVTAKITVDAFRVDEAPLVAEPHTFHVPLNEIEFVAMGPVTLDEAIAMIPADPVAGDVGL